MSDYNGALEDAREAINLAPHYTEVSGFFPVYLESLEFDFF